MIYLLGLVISSLLSTAHALNIKAPSTDLVMSDPIQPYFPGFSIEWDQIRSTFLADSKSNPPSNYLNNHDSIEAQLNKDTLSVYTFISSN